MKPPQQPLAAKPDYMPQLDGLRAVAIGCVLISHWAPDRLARALPWGYLGVRLFFVLSGFLITGILLRCRQMAEDGRVGKGQTAGRFYARRFLRIFPIYYLTLAVMAILNVEPIRQTLGWHALYMTNLYLVIKDQWPGPATHFWSLAAEEQFYLLWPWLILLAPRRLLRAIIIGAVAVGALSMGVTWALGWDWSQVNAQPLAALPSLGLGALLALLADVQWGDAAAKCAFSRICLIVGLIVFFAGAAIRLMHGSDVIKVIGFVLGSSAMSVWVIDRASTGFRGILGRVLSLGPVLYVGRISYGIYVLHMFAPPLVRRAMGERWVAGHSTWMLAGVYLAATMLAASLSWYTFENPINSLKRFIPYVPRRPAAASEPAPALAN